MNQEESNADKFQPTWESLQAYTVPQWYEDAKFGIFIHWGPYAVPAFGNEWYPRNMYEQGTKEFDHHVETYGLHTEFGYRTSSPSSPPTNSMQMAGHGFSRS